MKQRKIWIYAVVCAIVCGLSSAQTKNQEKDIESEIGIVLPAEKPNVTDEQRAELRKNKKYEHFFMYHDDTEKLFKEREACLAKTDPKEIRHYKPKIESLEKRIPKARKKFYQEARRLRQPMEKEYARLKATYDDLKDKAAKAEAAKNDAKAMRFAQESDKYTGKLASLEQSINVLNSVLFFDEYAPILDDEMEKAKKISEEGIDVKELRKTKTKSKKEKKTKNKD